MTTHIHTGEGGWIRTCWVYDKVASLLLTPIPESSVRSALLLQPPFIFHFGHATRRVEDGRDSPDRDYVCLVQDMEMGTVMGYG